MLSHASPAAGADEAQTKPTVDFDLVIKPIFQRNCIRCHGPSEQNGGVRLDDRAYVEVVSDSNELVLGGNLETNAVYSRITSPDPVVRMPKGEPPLTEEEIDAIRRWVLAGTPWPESPDRSAAPPTILQRGEELVKEHLKEFDLARPYAIALFVVLVSFMIRGSSLRRVASGRPSSRFAKWIAGTRPSQFGVVLLLIAIGGFVSIVMHRESESARLITSLKDQLTELNSRLHPQPHEMFGFPPQPKRPDHPKQIEGTYYRGNCERNPALFNGGNYRTATFRIGLCDSEHRPLKLGDSVGTETVFLRFELERAAGTPNVLFSPGIIGSVFFSKDAIAEKTTSRNMVPTRSPMVRLETLEKDQRWVAYYPLDAPAGDTKSTLSGLVYFYTGKATAEWARGQVQFGIQYDLLFEEGCLAEGSDLWMGLLLWNQRVALPDPGKIPLDEWFSWRPIPEITGSNSADPNLLGIPEHVKP